jgi:hypothetical protein
MGLWGYIIARKNMKRLFSQLYTKGKEITSWYGKPPKSQFRGDVIRFQLGRKEWTFYITPDEAATIIRALSAGLAHYLVNEDKWTRAKEKNENNRP